MNSNSDIIYLGNSNVNIKSYTPKKRHDASEIMNAKPSELLPVPAEMRENPRGWQWGFYFDQRETFAELSSANKKKWPYLYLNTAKVLMGWIVEVYKDSSVSLSHEGVTKNVVYAFDYGGRVYCGSWVEDYAYSYLGDQSIENLVNSVVGDSIAMLIPENVRDCLPLLGASCQVGASTWSECYKYFIKFQSTKPFSYSFLEMAFESLEAELTKKNLNVRELLEPYQPISFKQTISINLLNRVDYKQDVFPYIDELHRKYFI